jgi:hypothetical protein
VGLNYVDLDAMTRPFMLAESALGNHYASPRLTPLGASNWVPALNRAIEREADDWLATHLIQTRAIKDQEAYVRNGKSFIRNINIQSACWQLAEGEFNRYFIRGLCCRALDSGVTHLIVYRAKSVSHARPESTAKIGMHIAATMLLAALRSNNFVSIEDALAVPGGPNSGLSVRLP